MDEKAALADEVVDLTPIFGTRFHRSPRVSSTAPSPSGDGAASAGVYHALSRNFETKGWCFVRLPAHMCLNQATELPKLLSFFQNRDTEYKSRYSQRLAYGYSAPADHKETFRVLTGSRLLRRLPVEFSWLPNFAKDLDAGVLELLRTLSKPVFGCSSMELAQSADLPVSYLRESHFGMLDFVHYRNNDDLSRQALAEGAGGASVAEVNCVPHYDPGLLSVSFFSDRQGLQLLEPVFDATTGQQVGERWVDGPINTLPGQETLGVIWLGDAAVKLTGGRLKAGVHRVIYPSSSSSSSSGPRFTSWYEVCTTTQALGLEDNQAGEQAVAQADSSGVAMKNVLTPLRLPVTKGEKEADFLRKVERVYGIPMSKALRLGDLFKGPLQVTPKQND